MTEIFTFGQTRYDVDKAVELVDDHVGNREKVLLGSITLSGLLRLVAAGLIRVNNSHAASVDIEKPGIAVMTKNGALLIDGWHRAMRRQHLGKEEMNCYVIMDPVLIESIIINKEPRYDTVHDRSSQRL